MIEERVLNFIKMEQNRYGNGDNDENAKCVNPIVRLFAGSNQRIEARRLNHTKSTHVGKESSWINKIPSEMIIVQ